MALRAGASTTTDHTPDRIYHCNSYHDIHIQRRLNLEDTIQRCIQKAGEAELHIYLYYSVSWIYNRNDPLLINPAPEVLVN